MIYSCSEIQALFGPIQIVKMKSESTCQFQHQFDPARHGSHSGGHFLLHTYTQALKNNQGHLFMA